MNDDIYEEFTIDADASAGATPEEIEQEREILEAEGAEDIG